MIQIRATKKHIFITCRGQMVKPFYIWAGDEPVSEKDVYWDPYSVRGKWANASWIFSAGYL